MDHDPVGNEDEERDCHREEAAPGFASASASASASAFPRFGSSRSLNAFAFGTNTNTTPFRSRNHPDGPPPLSTSGFKPLPPSPPTPSGFKNKLLRFRGTMDPFTVRMNFKRAYLEKLTSSPGNQARAAAYALKYREQDEDLHQCIFEVLDNCNINLRANIMFFIEQLCELSKREGHQVYIDMIERDMPKIINLVAPGTKAGAMNIKVVRKVLESLQQKALLPIPLIQSLLKSLHNRETLALTSIATPIPQPERSDGVNMLGENDIEQRMEEDRDRHKRLREDTWAVDPDEEFDQLWEQGKAGLTEKLLQDCWDDKRQLDKEIELDKLLYEKPAEKEKEKENDTEMGGI
ncbi:hypothetical protein BLS_006583 [Venturia inaequalis]|uniref:CID domain-containing protein n=1 Tax=Venturia inaequalis TaxID=5025 RepID=A0A8H3US12_VENIN|nr:hypothetical protein BLS_006583 [Venturia inaequalis]KAE9976097.1 hypothetical protein EG327_008228 [Venturia inaequalis]KAE9976990.1 hypothetical protein EG328_002317 [Venturia inaequalis]RDI79401.1 hypothetical protein Vi05172_g10606 [Venturia inaequalis]